MASPSRGPRWSSARSDPNGVSLLQGGRWMMVARSIRYLEGTARRPVPAGPRDAFEAARDLRPVRPGHGDASRASTSRDHKAFHGLAPRLATLEASVTLDVVGRREESVPISTGSSIGTGSRRRFSALEHDPAISNPSQRRQTLQCPLSVETGRAASVVDLDTTMSGLVQYDVGELVRTVATGTPKTPARHGRHGEPGAARGPV